MVNDRQSLDLTTFASPAGGGAVEWRVSDAPVPYLDAVAAMEARAAAIAAREAPELVWLLEHPPLYTSGTSGKAGDLLDPRFPLFSTARCGPRSRRFSVPQPRACRNPLDRAQDCRITQPANVLVVVGSLAPASR